MSDLQAEAHPDTVVPHSYADHILDLAEIRMNHAATADPAQPALLLIPAQTEP